MLLYSFIEKNMRMFNKKICWSSTKSKLCKNSATNFLLIVPDGFTDTYFKYLTGKSWSSCVLISYTFFKTKLFLLLQINLLIAVKCTTTAFEVVRGEHFLPVSILDVKQFKTYIVLHYFFTWQSLHRVRPYIAVNAIKSIYFPSIFS